MEILKCKLRPTAPKIVRITAVHIGYPVRKAALKNLEKFLDKWHNYGARVYVNRNDISYLMMMDGTMQAVKDYVVCVEYDNETHNIENLSAGEFYSKYDIVNNNL